MAGENPLPFCCPGIFLDGLSYGRATKEQGGNILETGTTGTAVSGGCCGFAGAAAYEQMSAYLGSKSCKYPNSAKKIAFMMRRYEEDGFTSYWL